MTILGKIADRVIALLGLDFDPEIGLQTDHANRIRDDLYLGSRPTPQHVQTLKEYGVTHVVSCLEERERDGVAFLQREFQTLFLPARDSIDENIASTFPTLFEFASEIAHGEALFIHCQAGVSRSATLAIALLIERERRPFFETFVDVRSRRSRALPNIGFASQLERFEQERVTNTNELSSLTRYLCEMCHAPVEKQLLQTMLENHDYDAFSAISAIFGDDFPRVIQGVRY